MFKLLIFLFIFSCSQQRSVDLVKCPDGRSYPAHWWLTIDDKKKPEWEILPHAGKICESVILSKRNELGILSNFAATPFVFEGKEYASVEGMWQSLLYPELTNDVRHKFGLYPYRREQVEKMVAFEAKAAGDIPEEYMKRHGIRWVTYKNKKIKYWDKSFGAHYQLIKNAMQAKLEQNENVQNVLKSTGSLKLLPDHMTSPSDPPAWKYYKIWEELREGFVAN